MDFRILGPVEAYDEGRPLPLGGRKQRALLARLLLSANRPVSIERLIDDIWGEEAPASASHSVEVYISKLRMVLQASAAREFLARTRGGYVVYPDAGELDLDRFEALLARARSKAEGGRWRQAARLLREALSLWRGEPLEGLATEPFLPAARRQLEELRLAALEERVQADLALARHAELIPELHALVAEHPGRERLREQLMLALYRTGRQADALAFYRETHRDLVERFGIEPSAALRELQERLLRQDCELDSPAPATARRQNLPAQATELIGRDEELAEGRRVLEGETRLLTLTGPPGAGKTRLAIALAEDSLDEFRNGVFFVSLAPLARAELVPSAIARELGVSEQGGEPIEETLRKDLASREVLIVLDNFEHVLPAARVVSDLLMAAPGVKILVTSRAVLHVYGEHAWPVPPLALPRPGTPWTAEGLARSPAVALFATRARAVNRDFKLTDANAPAVTEICARLDGLPLAIELAAARANLLSPEALLERLERRLPLLTGGHHGMPARQRTLRATIDWSFNLLDSRKQALFRRLAVFAGGWTLQAAESVCALGQKLADEIPELLGSLVERALVQHAGERGGELRFTMLETIREYAFERLEESGEAAEVRHRHAEYLIGLGKHADERFEGPENANWITRLEAEAGNVRSALEWCLGQTPTSLESSFELASGAWMLWGSPTPSELRGWLERALVRAGELGVSPARGLYAAGVLALRQGDLREARDRLEGAVPLLEDSAPTAVRSLAAAYLAYVLSSLGERERALDLAEDALVEARRSSEDFVIATATNVLANLAHHSGDYARARALLEETLALRRKLGGRLRIVNSLSNLGYAALVQGDLAEAARFLHEGLELADPHEMRASVVLLGVNLAHVALFQREYPSAETHYREAITIAGEIGDKLAVAEALRGCAALAAACGDPRRCAHLWGAADSVDELTGEDGTTAVTMIAESFVEPAMREFDQFSEVADEGRCMSLEEAVDYALGATYADGPTAKSVPAVRGSTRPARTA